MFITSRPATAIIIALAAFLIVSRRPRLLISSGSANRSTASGPARRPSLRRRSLTTDNPRRRPAHTNRHPTAYAKSRRREYRPGRSGGFVQRHQWKQLAGRHYWLSNRPLGEWHGVSTDADGRVADLRLDGKQLSGSILAELGNLDNLEIWPESPLAGFRTTLIRRITVV